MTALIAGLFFFSAPAWAQISLVHVTACGPQSFPSSTCTIPSTSSGNILVVAWTSNNGGGGAVINSVADNANNVYAEAGNARAVDASANSMADVWYSKNIQSGATVVTVTPSPTGTIGTALVWEFSGVDTLAPLDQTAVLNNQVATTTPSGAAVTTSAAFEVVVSVANIQGAVNGLIAGSLFSSDSIANGNGWAHLITSSVGTYQARWNNSVSGTYAASTVSFKAASSSGSLNACDLSADGSVNVLDVSRAVSMTLGLSPCTANINGPTVCNVVTVQRIVNATLGGACVVDAASLMPTGLSCSPSIVNAPGTSSCTVTLSGAALSTATVSLSSNVASLTVPGSMTIGTGASSGTFTATAGTVSSSQTVTVTASLNGQIKTTTVSLTPLVVSHSVTLTWIASTSSNVAGYNVYRGAASGGPYATKVNSSLVTGLGYIDTTVLAGQTYYYVATSVDTSGNESVPSNQATAVIPSP